MANTTTQRTRKTTSRAKTTAVASDATSEAPQTEAQIKEVGDSSSAVKETITPKDIDSAQYVIVRNGFQGKLVYRSRRTGEMFIWEEFGAEQEMELRELRNAKNSYKKFFINNWFMFDEDWIVDYLGVRQYYKNAIPIDSFDDIFELAPNALAEKIEKLSDGQKKSVAYRAKELIAESKIDSLSVINTLEKALGIELIER